MLLFAMLLWLGACPREVDREARQGASPAPPSPPSVPAAPCRLRRAAFDIGSATTKVKVADIDICERRIVAVLYADDAPVFYRDDVLGAQPGQARFSAETMARGMEVLRRFKDRASAFEPDGYAAVATSAFRRAENGAAFIERIRERTRIWARMISQGEEAELGFLGAITALGIDPHRAFVWDVGGQSMQMTIMRPDGGLRVYQSRLASGQMRDHIITELQRRPDAESPNPISHDIASRTRAFVQTHALSEVPPDIKARLADTDTIVIGIGALKYYGDGGQGSREMTREGLEASLGKLIGLNDQEIGGEYAATQVSDRLLVVSFMGALGIRRMQLADVDLSDGLLFHPDYWELPAR